MTDGPDLISQLVLNMKAHQIRLQKKRLNNLTRQLHRSLRIVLQIVKKFEKVRMDLLHSLLQNQVQEQNLVMHSNLIGRQAVARIMNIPC